MNLYETIQIGSISITNRGEAGARVSYPKDYATNQALKATFPKARWNPDARGWDIPGKLAARRAEAWATEMADALAANTQAAKTAAQAAIELLAARKSEIKSTKVYVQGNVVSYAFSYDADCVAIARSMPNKSFSTSSKTWTWYALTSADVEAIIAGCNKIFELRTIAIEQAKAAKEAQARRWGEQPAQAVATPRLRYLELAARAPRVGETIRLRYGKQAVTVESHGKLFRADEDTSSISDLIGCEGERVQYVYYREATAEEIAKLEAAEANIRDAPAKVRALRAAIDKIAQSADAPVIGKKPEGEVLWQDVNSLAVGYATYVILTPDDYLWHVTYDGSDGAAWGDYNCGYNTRGCRLPATPELIQALKV